MENVNEKTIHIVNEKNTHKVNALIGELVSYGMKNGLVAEEDKVYTINRLLEILGLDEYEEDAQASGMPLEDILAGLLDWEIGRAHV